MAEIEDLFTPEEVDQYLKMSEKRWVRVDPVTKAPHESAKECFWKIDDVTPVCRAGENTNKPKMGLFVVRYYRNQTYESAISPEGGKSTRNVAWHEVSSKGELVSPGSIKGIEVDEFLKQFVEDGKQTPVKVK